MKNLKVFWMGLLISFLGSLPLGTMNVTATHISVRNGVQAGFIAYYILAVAEHFFVK